MSLLLLRASLTAAARLNSAAQASFATSARATQKTEHSSRVKTTGTLW